MVRHGSRSTMAHNAPMKRERTLEQLRQRGVHLEWATNGWNVMEVVVTISLGLQAGSLALIAFGLDSVVEIFASTVVIRNLRDRRSDPGDRRVHRSLRMIAGAFWILAAFLVAISVRGLIRGDRPDSSPLGVAYLALTAVAMFGLSLLKRGIARELGSEALQAEAALTFLDGCLSTGILTALLLNGWLGWWWSDAAAALLVAAFAVKEGIDHWLESAPHDEACGGLGQSLRRRPTAPVALTVPPGLRSSRSRPSSPTSARVAVPTPGRGSS